MAKITSMSHKALVSWIVALDKAIASEDDESNKNLFKKWKGEAEAELKARQERKERFLRNKEKGYYN